MTIQHHRFDSDIIDDTPEAILAEVEKYCAAIAHHSNCEIFVRRPLTIDREIEFSGRRVARVTARWTFLCRHPLPEEGQGLFGIP